MSAFSFKDGVLFADDVAVPAITEAVGSPVYVYSATEMVGRYRAFRDALSGLDGTIFYAVKANPNLAVIATFAQEGAGADVVSVGEMKRALAAGVPADKIVFAGVGKTREEMAEAIDAGILQINVESEWELSALSEVAASKGAVADVAFRVNPDVDPKTHAKITTGKKENKFGVPIERAPALFEQSQSLPGIRARSLSVHIGSQLGTLEPFRTAYERLRDMTQALRAAGHVVDHLDLGGGLGVVYRDEDPEPSLSGYAAIVWETVGDLGCRLGFEPGRWMVADAGVLVTRVIHDKPGEGRRFVVIDAAMNDLIRPTLYEAWQKIEPVVATNDPIHEDPADVVGPICESGDYVGKGRALPVMEEGALLAIRSAGAYGAAMSSTYNSRLLIPEVLVRGATYAVVRPRQTYEELLGLDRIPDWVARQGD